jgi:hypothetical protein
METMPAQHKWAKDQSLMCGSCQWFRMGFRQKGCRETRKVEIHTFACVEFKEPMENIYQDLDGDKYLEEIRAYLASGAFHVDISLLDELKNYLQQDDFSSYRFGTKQDLESMMGYLQKIVGWRARVSTIYTSLIDLKIQLEEVNEKSQMWLYNNYAIIRNLKNDILRQAAFNQLIPEYSKTRKRIKTHLLIAEHIDSKLDANERTIGKILSSAEKLWFSGKKGISYV